MKLKIEIKMDNAAFGETNGLEVSRILTQLAGKVDYERLNVGDAIACMDANGNRVGQLKVTR